MYAGESEADDGRACVEQWAGAIDGAANMIDCSGHRDAEGVAMVDAEKRSKQKRRAPSQREREGQRPPSLVCACGLVGVAVGLIAVGLRLSFSTQSSVITRLW